MKGRLLHSLLSIVIVALLSTPLVLAQEGGPNILFVFDSSGSMLEPLGDKNKLETAKEVLSALVGDLPPGTNVGLVVYGHREEKKCDDIEIVFPVGPPDVTALRQKIASLQAKGNTPIATALEKAAAELRGHKGKRTIVLISDGKETCKGDPVGMAEFIRNEFGIDVVIHAVGFAVGDEARQQLSKIAQAGGGNYYAANNAQQLKESLVEIKEKAVEPPKEFFVEEFDGPSLGESWEILNANPDNSVLDEGKFVVVTTPGSIQEETVSNVLLYNGEIPGQNYVVTAEFSTSILNYPYGNMWNTQLCGLVLYSDKDNFLILTTGAYATGSLSPRSQVIFFKRQGGKDAPVLALGLGGGREDPDTYLLKIERRKYKYTAYYYDPEAKEGEGEWKGVGTHAMLGKKLRPGLIAFRGGDAAEVVTEFDSFKITELGE